MKRAIPKAKYIDYERLELKNHFRQIIKHGTPDDLREALEAFGYVSGTNEMEELIAEFKRISGVD